MYVSWENSQGDIPETALTKRVLEGVRRMRAAMSRYRTAARPSLLLVPPPLMSRHNIY